MSLTGLISKYLSVEPLMVPLGLPIGGTALSVPLTILGKCLQAPVDDPGID